MYAPNTHRDAVAGDVSIGLRIAEIRTYDEGTLVRRRTFTYRQSGTTVDFRRLDIADFTERRQVGVAAGRVDEYLVIHSDSVLPGARVENARVFYGEVTEEVTDVRNGKSVRTDYEYDTRLISSPKTTVSPPFRTESSGNPYRFRIRPKHPTVPFTI